MTAPADVASSLERCAETAVVVENRQNQTNRKHNTQEHTSTDLKTHTYTHTHALTQIY